MPLVVYLDETGDHSLQAEDKGFPIFALVMLVCDTDVYAHTIVPMFYDLKFEFFRHEGVIIHSRDIRKMQSDFVILKDPVVKAAFYDRLDQIMGVCDYRIIATVIDKQKHKQRYGVSAMNPYDLALTFAMERLLPLIEVAGQSEVQLIAEARGKNEDDQLRLSFLSIVNGGTDYIPGERFRKIQFRLDFKSKAMNIVGTQMADLVAYPIARHVLDPTKENPAYDVIASKFYKGSGRISGLKTFP